MADLADIIESERLAKAGRWIELKDNDGNVLGEARVIPLTDFDFKLEVSVLAQQGMGRAEAMRTAAPMLCKEIRGATIGGKEIGEDAELIRKAVEGSSAVYQSILSQAATTPGE